MKLFQQIKANNPFGNPKKLKKILLVTFILLITICICQTFMIVDLSKTAPTSFLRFVNSSYNAITKLDRKLGYSIPIEALLLSKTSKWNDSIPEPDFNEEQKNIQDYLSDIFNIVTCQIINESDKDAWQLRLHFDLPTMLELSARTEDGKSIPIKKVAPLQYLDLSQFYTNPNESVEPITIYLTAEDPYFAYEYMFRLKIKIIKYTGNL